MRSAPSAPAHPRRRAGRIARAAALAAGALAAFVVLAWLTGRILSDRWGWSQWLLWIPTPAAIVACMLGLASVLPRARGRAWRRGAPWAIALTVVLIYFAAIEHRLLRRPDDEGTGGLRIVHWTMSHEKRNERPEHADTVIALGGDVTVLLDAWGVQRQPTLDDWVGASATRRRDGRVTVLSRLPLREIRPLVAAEGILVQLVVLDASAEIGRPLVIYVVDLPSRLAAPRMATAHRLRGLLDSVEAPPPDVVLGDFNMTRGGAALGASFPDLRHAYDEAGAGYGATFHRRLPLYHIDHLLLGGGVRAQSYRIVDPGRGRHRVQVVRIAPSPRAPERAHFLRDPHRPDASSGMGRPGEG